MDSVSAFLRNGWASVVGFFGPMSFGETINVVFIGAIVAAALFQIIRQIIRHSQRRYYLMVIATGVAFGVGYGVYLAMAGFVLPKFSLDSSQTAAVSSAVGTLIGVCAAVFMFRLILKPKTGNRVHRRSRKNKDNLATQTGNFGNTQADSDNPDWGSTRKLQRTAFENLHNQGLVPTAPQVDCEIMRLREGTKKSRKR